MRDFGLLKKTGMWYVILPRTMLALAQWPLRKR